MTLKCKIKEISELKTAEDLENFKKQRDQLYDEGTNEQMAGEDEILDEDRKAPVGEQAVIEENEEELFEFIDDLEL